MDQLRCLYDEASVAQYNKMKFDAGLHGIDLDKAVEKETSTRKKDEPASDGKSIMYFGDPEQYSKMTVEQREGLTRRMMSAHRQWAMNPTTGGGARSAIGSDLDANR